MSNDVAAPVIERRLPATVDTQRLGRSLAHACRTHAMRIREHGLHVNVTGELGVGKTALVRAWLRAFGIVGPVKSPTFAVLEPWISLPNPAASRPGLTHNSSLDFITLISFGLPTQANSGRISRPVRRDSICAIEWPEKASDRLPQADLTVAPGDRRRRKRAPTGRDEDTKDMPQERDSAVRCERRRLITAPAASSFSRSRRSIRRRCQPARCDSGRTRLHARGART